MGYGNVSGEIVLHSFQSYTGGGDESHLLIDRLPSLRIFSYILL